MYSVLNTSSVVIAYMIIEQTNETVTLAQCVSRE